LEGQRRPGQRGLEDEFADFIEEDFDDDDAKGPEDDDADILRKPHKNIVAVTDAAGLDEVAMEDMKEAFGDGLEYDWALELQEQEEDDQGRVDPDDPEGLARGLELKDVFEPSQLVDRMLTDEDNRIRVMDQPERFQLARKPYRDLELTDEEFKEESLWISNLMWPKKALGAEHREQFQKSIAKVLEFLNIDEYEVPFIFQHRKDYLIHAQKIEVTPDPYNPNAPTYVINAEKLLNQTDLWEIFDMDLKFRALIEKRHALQRTYDNLGNVSDDFKDPVIEEMLPSAETMEELQDVQDYIHFQHSSRLTDLSVLNGSGTNGVTHRRPGASKMIFERIRTGKVYGLVRAFGISADAFAQNALHKEGRRQFTEDPSQRPDDMADSDEILEPPDYPTGAQCLRAAKAMFAEEITLSPKMRKVVRQNFFISGIVDCYRTEKGLRKIDDQHPYYDFKYLRNQQLTDVARKPDRFLCMLRAEEEGLVEVKVRMENPESFKKRLYADLESDNFSEIADAWNRERRDVLDIAFLKLEKIMSRGVKEALRLECENTIAKSCREEYLRRLDQAPYKPKGMVLGTIPKVLTLSNGTATVGREAICWAALHDDGRVLGNGKFTDLALGDAERNTEDGADVKALVEVVDRWEIEVIGISGFSAETRKLYKLIDDIVERKELHGNSYEDDDGNTRVDKLDVVIVNDEVARLYQTSDRANMEHPGFAPLTKYCVGIAKYLQSPLKEYASLGRDIISITFDSAQRFVPQEKILKALETAIVDMVNLCGVEINDAIGDLYTANLLPYVAGLGPRKAAQLIKVINHNNGFVTTRAELVGDPDKNILAAVGPKVWNNCASFLHIDFDETEPDADYLDNTRVHPEDYDLGRKMAADALEWDEEDIEAEQAENGPGAIVRKLISEQAQEKVNDLILEEYAEQLEKSFNQRKRATLETIRAELQQPYEELRRGFVSLTTNEIFTMLTGETPESLCEGMIVPISIKKVADDYVEGKMDCGIEGTVPALAISNRPDVSAKQLFSVHQTVQAKITYLNRKQLSANFSLREDELQRPFRKEIDRMRDEWDDEQEKKDKETMMEKNDVSGRTQRVIKHPLFKPFSSIQAEEYLGSQARGDLVIRPSSKGPDHLAVTWKVSDNIYQHIDVLELDKTNQLSGGTTLKIGGRYNYSDLDELIVNHVKAMAKKVDEMMLHEKYQNLSKADTGKRACSCQSRNIC
jgi:transcription elongation factor SPT6